MASYCLLADLKSYLNVTVTTDDALLQLMLDAATSRINSSTGRTFQATIETTRYFDPSKDLIAGELWLDEDLSCFSSVVNGDGVDITTRIYTNPRNVVPYFSLGIKTSAAVAWTYTNNYQNAIAVTGKWAYMRRVFVSSISRTNNTVTATVCAPELSVGSLVCVTGFATAGNFNGTFTVTVNTGTEIKWQQPQVDGSDGTGYIMFTPIDIVTACRRLAAWMYRQKDTQMGDADRPILAGDGSVIMPSTLPQDVAQLLRPYVRVLI